MDINSSNISYTDSGNVRFSGISSGIDYVAVVDSIMTAKRLPAVSIENKIEANNQKLTDFESLKSLSTNMATALGALRGGSSLLGNNVFETKLAFTSSRASDDAGAGHTPSAAGNIMGVTVSDTADTGTHVIEVTQLAKAHQIRADAMTSKTDDLTTLGMTAGDFQINGKTVTLSGGDSLLDLRDKINNADAGVVASIVSASDTEHYLVLSSEDTGVDNAITFDGGGTATSDSLGLTDGLGAIKTQMQEAKNAIMTVDGIAGIERASNTVDDVLSGVTISLYAAEADTEIVIDIENDLSSVKSAVTDFVTAYNELREFVADQRTEKDRTDDDEDNPEYGSLAFNSVFRSVAAKLNEFAAMDLSTNADGYQSLSQIGVTMNDEYKLEIDDTEFDEKILADLDSMKTLFAFDFSSSDSRISYISHDNSTTYQSGGYYLNIAGTDADGNVTSANIKDASASGAGGSDDGSATVDGKVITITDASGAENLKVLFNGGANFAGIDDISINFTRGVADEFYHFFNDLNKSEGILTKAVESVEEQNEDYEVKVLEIDTRLEYTRKTMEYQYIAMERALAELDAIKQSITALMDSQNSSDS